MIANAHRPKPLVPRSPETKYTGMEPDWRTQPTADQRMSRLIAAFTWYGYHYGKKEAKTFVVDWLTRHDRQREARDFGRVPETAVPNQIGWLCRMNVMGLELVENEAQRIDSVIADHIASAAAIKQVIKTEDVATRVTIQDRLREKISEAAAELEAMYDDMIQTGSKMSASYKPMSVLRGMNVAPQLVGDIAGSWRIRLDELETVLAGTDGQLVEGYANFSKMQIRNLVKFAEQVIADCGSYVQVKKTERAPRKKKPISAERLTQRFRYLREFDELKLVSEPVVKLVGSQELWLYDTKKRKLIYVVADSHVGTMTVKGTSLIGFDTSNSVQKTLRKPAEQIKALLTGGVAATRRYFKDIKATEVKFNGRGNENLILLKVR